MFTLIKHALVMRQAQSIATFLSVALAAAVTFALALSFLGVQAGLHTSQERLGADLMVIPADAATDLDQNALLFTGAPANMYMSADVVDEVAQVSGVERVSAQFYGQTLDASCCSASEPARLIGYDAASDWVVSPWTDEVVDGALGAGQIIAGANLVADFTGGGTILGHNVDMVASLDVTGTDLDGSVLMDIDEVRAFVADTEELQYLWDEYGSPDTLVSCVLVDVAEGERDAVVAELSAKEGIAVIEASNTVARMVEQLGAVFAIMAGAAALLVIATLFQLFARFFSLAWDRRSELALYRALGASKRDVSVLIGGEAALLVGGGVLAGLVLGVLLYAAVPNMLAIAGSFPYVPPAWGVCVLVALLVIVLFGIIGLVAIALPLVRAGRIDPSSAMQTGDID